MGLLDGYRVLDLTDDRGLIAGRILADLGADVVLVEPPGGSGARSVAPLPAAGGTSLFFDAFAANRRGMTLDLDTAGGQQQLRRLAARADFLLESADPGHLEERGLGWDQLRTVNPALIHVSITAFGSTGPKAGYAASDLIVWAAGGPLDPHRDGDRPPVRISVPQAFLHAGADAAAGALFAHHARRRTGQGQHVDVSAQASLGIATLGQNLADAVGDAQPSWERPAKRVDQSGSGSRTAPDQKKWAAVDGTIEFHIGVGPAAGRFTDAFFRWMADEGAVDADLAQVDWSTVHHRIADGSFSDADMARARSAVGAFLATRTQQEVLQAATERKLLCVPILDIAGVAAAEQLAERGVWVEVGDGPRRRRIPGPYAHVTADEPAFAHRRPAPLLGEHTADVLADWLADAAAPPAATSPRAPGGTAAVAPATPGSREAPLAGLRVLDLSWVVAGPVIGRALADFGATVVRVESSTRPETARHMPPFYGGRPGVENSALYGTWNAGKLGVTLDLSGAEGQAVARDLAGWSDVVIEAFSPGQMRRWGLDYATLSAGREDLIMLSTSIMGQTGPARRLAGFGNIGAALSGFQDLVGWPDRPAFGPFGPYTDYVGPRFSLVALLAVLDRRQRTGRGCYLDVSQVETGIYFLAPELAHYFLDGTVAHRSGNADRQFAPHGVYPCRAEDGRDRFAAIAVLTDDHWTALTQVMGTAEAAALVADPRLRGVAGRREHAAAIDEAITAWTRSRTAAEVEQELQARGVPAHVSASSRDFCADPQVHHRGQLVELPHPLFGTAVVEGPRYLLSETPGRVGWAAPQFGQDNEKVLLELLGYDKERIAQLTQKGVLR